MFVNATKRLRSSLLRVHLAVNTRRLCTSSLGGQQLPHECHQAIAIFASVKRIWPPSCVVC